MEVSDDLGELILLLGLQVPTWRINPGLGYVVNGPMVSCCPIPRVVGPLTNGHS